MKRLLLLFAVILLVQTQTGFAQPKKYVLFEGFTNSNCDPCAVSNPKFFDTCLVPFPNDYHYIQYHVSWPTGHPIEDPMNVYNKPDVQNRVDYYGKRLSGVPIVMTQGSTIMKHPALYRTPDMTNQLAIPTNMLVSVKLTKNTSSINTDVTVKSVGTPPSGNYVLRVALIERDMIYPSPPGDNGEKEWHDVFRNFIPDVNGTPITLPASGSSVNFNFNYNVDPEINMNLVAVIAYLQETTTKKVEQSGASFDPPQTVGLNEPVSSSLFELGQNFPNPATYFTSIPVNVKSQNNNILHIMDMTGHIVREVTVSKGQHNLFIDTSNLASGLYMYKISDGNENSPTRIMNVVK